MGKLSNDNDCADVETGYCIGQSIPVIQYEMFFNLLQSFQ